MQSSGSVKVTRVATDWGAACDTGQEVTMCHEARDNVKCCTQAFRLCHTQTHLPTLSDQAGSSCMREMCYHPHSCHHPHSAGYGRSPHVSVTAQIRTPLSLLVGSCRPQLVSPSALCGIWSPIVPAEVTVRPAHVSHVMVRCRCCPLWLESNLLFRAPTCNVVEPHYTCVTLCYTFV